MRRSHKLRIRVATICGSVLLACMVAELALRVLDVSTQMPVKVLPVEKIIPEDLQAMKLQGLLAESDTLRIAFIGDSFTFGFGVQPHEGFVSKTGELLRRRGYRCKTINLGKTGEDLIREWAIFNRTRDQIRPNVVIQVMTANDVDIDLYKDLGPVLELLRGRSWLSQYSRLVAFVEMKIRWILGNRRVVAYMQGGATPQMRERSWRIVSYAIESMKQLVEEGGATYVLVRFPYMHHLDDYPLSEEHRRTAEIAQRLKIPYLDLKDTYVGRSEKEVTLPRDTHPTPLGHSMAAEAIADFLAREVLPALSRATASQQALTRTPEQIRASEIRHYEEILKRDPTCRSARISLDRIAGPATTP
ncbi:MAG: SGNH/GDSL hydrolase family protein [Phycisphaerae bacterium]|nr:SGNH/GDSL hydrolase family protein [Phycisphaerae bacterium]